jgi:UDP-sugar transporter A1/2/3
MKIIVPSVLYAIQNNLQYVAVANLSAPVFQTMYQLKIVTTAIFSVFLLKRNLLAHQWMSIFTLFLGASAVQLSQQAGSIGGATCNLTGLLTVIVSCFTSGFSGVYFEKTLKNKQAKASIWLRNVQMSFFGILIGMLGCLTNDRSKIAELGFFYGYNGIVWTVIMLQALGGLVVSMVVKHADNLMKGFATSLSIIISCGLSAVLFNDLRVNRIFLLGSTAVVASTIAFGYAPPQKEPKLLATTQ